MPSGSADVMAHCASAFLHTNVTVPSSSLNEYTLLRLTCGETNLLDLRSVHVFTLWLCAALLAPFLCVNAWFVYWSRHHKIEAIPSLEEHREASMDASKVQQLAMLSGIELPTVACENGTSHSACSLPDEGVPSIDDIVKDKPTELLGVSVAMLHDAIFHAASSDALEAIHRELHESHRFLRRSVVGGVPQGRLAIISCDASRIALIPHPALPPCTQFAFATLLHSRDCLGGALAVAL
jgi:hypothetical protein|eukprot:1068293-Prymnesium_polylepis.1